jgi:hypothetical protein
LLTPTSALQFHARIHNHKANLLHVVPFPSIIREVFDKEREKHSIWLIMAWMCNYKVKKKKMLKLHTND